MRITEPENWTEQDFERKVAEDRNSRDRQSGVLALVAAGFNAVAFMYDRNPVWVAAAVVWIVAALFYLYGSDRRPEPEVDNSDAPCFYCGGPPDHGIDCLPESEGGTMPEVEPRSNT